jgi:hypothetical protein
VWADDFEGSYILPVRPRFHERSAGYWTPTAKVAGIGANTLLRWLKVPEFQKAYREARRAAFTGFPSTSVTSTLEGFTSRWMMPFL